MMYRISASVPVILQTEAAECGLACIAMIAAFYGYRTDLSTLRRRFSISLKGATLKELIDTASSLHLAGRPVRLELNSLRDLQLPCILHWNLNHFVVLKGVTKRWIEIHDPAQGELRLTLDETSRHFTGVALELTPTADFARKEDRQRVAIRSMLGPVVGLRRNFSQILALALALEVFALISPLFIQWVVDGAVVSADRDLLLLLALGFGLLLLIQTGLSFARSWMVLFAATHLNLNWSTSVFTHLMRLPISWFEKRHLGDVVSRFDSVRVIQRTLTTSFVEAIIDGVMASITLVMMFLYSGTLTAIVLGSLALYALLRLYAYKPLRRATEDQIMLTAKSSSVFMESVRAITAIKLSNQEEERRARWLNAFVDATNRGVATERMTIGYRVAQGLLSGGENLAVVYFGALLVIDSMLSIGMLFAFFAYKTTFSTRSAFLIDKFVELRMLGLQGERLADIVLEPPEEDSTMPIRDRQLDDLTLQAIEVSFRYSQAEPWVLRHVNFTLAPGESVAIVGPSGCGKTTLLKVMLGLLRPTEGEVRIGGFRIDQFGLRQYRRLLGAVLQDDQLLAGSVADNICSFSGVVDNDRMEGSAKLAVIHDEICAMPMGYATLVGDMGAAISGGQKQRILLARALYKQPKLLFLDEATSHLDVDTESLVNNGIRELQLTRVIVAHRPQTISSAERVITLNEGMVKQDLRVAPRSEFARSVR